MKDTVCKTCDTHTTDKGKLVCYACTDSIIKQVKMQYEYEVIRSDSFMQEIKVFNQSSYINVSIWLKRATFDVYGDDDGVIGKEEVPIEKLPDLLEILL